VTRTTRIGLAACTAAAVTVLALTWQALHFKGGAPVAGPAPPAPAATPPQISLAPPSPAPTPAPPPPETPPSVESVRLILPADGPPAPARPDPAPPGPDPQASLMRPEPAVPAPAATAPPGGEPRRVTVARWPLGAPTLHEPPLPEPSPAPAAQAASWCRPQPLEPAAPPVLADAAKPAPPGPANAGLSPMPAAAAAPRHRAPARARAVPFTGTHACLLDADRTLLLPRDVYRRLAAPEARALFVTPGPEPSLWLYTATGLGHWAEQFNQAGAGSRARAARRVVLAQTEACAVDRGGRLRLPEPLAQFAGLRREVVLLGAGDHLELWDAQRWQQQRDRPGPAAAPAAPDHVRGAGGVTSRPEEEGQP
jgi:division/cell wall cluster transcriptional repressor MraZ